MLVFRGHITVLGNNILRHRTIKINAKMNFVGVITLFTILLTPGTDAFSHAVMSNLPTSISRVGMRPNGICTIKAQDGKELRSAVLRPCKKLCPGCEPWICPMAPKHSEAAANQEEQNFVSESSRRLAELRQEQLVEAERLRLEAIAAGVQEISNDAQFSQTVLDDTQSGQLTVVFWGGRWCRKCVALKPRYVTLAKELTSMDFIGGLQFTYADAKGVGQETMSKCKVSAVPCFQHDSNTREQTVSDAYSNVTQYVWQCWRNGEMLGSYVASNELALAIPEARDLIISFLELKKAS